MKFSLFKEKTKLKQKIDKIKINKKSDINLLNKTKKE